MAGQELGITDLAAWDQATAVQIEQWVASENPLPVVSADQCPIMLGAQEAAHWMIGAYVLGERTTYSSQGGYGGVSVPVAFGVRAHVGAKGSSTAPVKMWDCIDQGYFVVTNRRVVFSGEAHPISVPLGNILSVECVQGQYVALSYSGQSGKRLYHVTAPHATVAYIRCAVRLSHATLGEQ